jgi:curved DNA-binding protein
MSQPQSLYEILEVSPTATPDEIKKSYRRLAMLYHPDKAGDNPVAAAKYAEITKAYEILIDPEKRALYDKPSRTRTFYRSSWRPPGGSHFSAEQPHIENTRSNAKSWKKAENKINLDDLFGDHGSSNASNSMPRYSQNEARAGEREDGEDIFCEVDVDSAIAQKGGMVQFEYRRNRRMDGLQVQSVLELFYLRVPPNTRDREVLTIDKMGHAGLNGGRSGDLHCTVKIVSQKTADSTEQQPSAQSNTYTTTPRSSSEQKHSSESAQVPYTIMELPVSFPEAVLGSRIQVKTPQGEVAVSIPPRSSSGRKLRLKGLGENGEDCILVIKIVIPAELDAESIQLIEAFAERNPISPRDN